MGAGDRDKRTPLGRPGEKTGRGAGPPVWQAVEPLKASRPDFTSAGTEPLLAVQLHTSLKPPFLIAFQHFSPRVINTSQENLRLEIYYILIYIQMSVLQTEKG